MVIHEDVYSSLHARTWRVANAGGQAWSMTGTHMLALAQVHEAKLCACVAQYWNVNPGLIFGGKVGYKVCSLFRPGLPMGSDFHN